MYPTKAPILVSINGVARELIASPYAYKHFPKRASGVVCSVDGTPALVALTSGKGRAADGRTRFYFYATPADAPESARGAKSFWVEITPTEAVELAKPGATLVVTAIRAPSPEATVTEAIRAEATETSLVEAAIRGEATPA